MKRFLGLLIGLLLLAVAVPALAQTQTDITVRATAQRFEGGLMIWRADNSYIYVLTSSGRAYGFAATTYARFPDNPYISREHPIRPINGFGRIWGYYGSIRRALGWPVQPEIGFNMRIVTSGNFIYLQQRDGTIYKVSRGGSWTVAKSFPVVQPTSPPPPPPAPTLPPAPPPQQGNAFIANFDVQPQAVNPGGSVSVFWNIVGVQQAFLEVYDLSSNNAIDLRYRLAPAGSTTVTIPANVGGNVRVVLTGAGRPGQPSTVNTRLVQSDAVVQVQTIADQTQTVYTAFQQYERGFMLWRSDTGGIYVFSGSGSGTYSFYPGSAYGNLPDNPYTSAPAGLVRPINGFGRIWGNYSVVRNGLGWATASEQGYQATIVVSRGTPVSFTLPTGAVVNVSAGGTWST